VRTRNAHPATSDLKVQLCHAHKPPLSAPSHVARQVINDRARPWSRRSPRALPREMLACREDYE
jgi:hypothetical protein